MNSLEKQHVDFKKSNSVFFYSKPGCPYCEKLNSDLTNYGIPFKEIKIQSQDVSTMLKNVTKMTTYPMLFIGPQQIGGYSDFLQLCMTNQIEEKLNNVNIKPSKSTLDF